MVIYETVEHAIQYYWNKGFYCFGCLPSCSSYIMLPEPFNIKAGTLNCLDCHPVMVIAGDKRQQQPLQTVEGRVSTTVSMLNDHTFMQQNAVKHALYQQFRIIDKEYEAFVEMVCYLQPSQQQLAQFKEDLILFCWMPGRRGSVPRFQQEIANSHHNSLTSYSSEGQRHHCAEALCWQGAPQQCTLCGSCWQRTHLPLPRHRNCNQWEPR